MILVFGSLNIDLVFTVDALPAPGETVLTESYLTVPGGKGANQAVAAARALGSESGALMAGCVGPDAFGSLATAALRESGVDVALVVTSTHPTGCASIAVERSGQNAIAVASGANLDARQDPVPDRLLGAQTVLVLQHEVPIAENLALARRARERGARVVLNAAPARPLPAGEWSGLIDVLIVNETELAMLAGTGSKAAHELSRSLEAAVVATLGSDGAILVTGDETYRIGALSVPKVVDTTAAGDSFVGAFAAALDRGLELSTALRWASVAGGLACTRLGAQTSIPTREEIEAHLPKLAEAVRA
jgi:ribokinase